MRLISSLIAIALFTAACGADGSDVVGDDLALAQQEIARLEALLAEQPEAVSNEEPVVREVSGRPYSVGPCGVFALNGSRVLELSYELGEDDYIKDDPPPAWTDTGIDMVDVLLGLAADPVGWLEDHPFLARQPALAVGVQLVPGWNHAWFVYYTGIRLPRPPRHLAGLYYEGQGFDGKYDWSLQHFEGLTFGNVVSESAFFGLDENCDWGWIEMDGHVSFMDNAWWSFTEGENGEPEIASLRYKGYACSEWFGGPYYVTYDPEEQAFVTDCLKDRDSSG